MNTKIAVAINGVTQNFGKITVLRDINLQVQKGEIIGLLGPSGAGKTTLVKTMIGMYPPKEGSVKIGDTIMPNLSVLNRIGYMAQADALYEDLNGMENILFFAELYGVPKKAAKERAMTVMRLVQLEADAKKTVKFYSGGMRRRLSLCIALVHEPQLLILDEPTVGIDPVLRRTFWDEFLKLRNEGRTIIITTHAMDEAGRCDRLAFLRDGVLIAQGPPDSLMQESNEDSVEGAFLYFANRREVTI
jgi:ABC-2 type transport system ATP-binding protein